jgi:N-acetyl-anhydromuramyl-L-alanine amidase AmpD
MTHSGLTTGIQLTSDSGDRTGKVDRFIVHHAAATSLPLILSLFQPGGRKVSANYALKDKQLICAVDENRRAFTSGTVAWDGRAVTVEVANSSAGGSWPVSDASFDTLARLIADVATRYRFDINDTTILTHQELKRRYNVSYATACPGDMQRRKAELINLARQYAGGGAVPAAPVPAPAPAPASGVTVRWIQERLRAHGFMAFVDNKLGSQTRGFIRQFQAAKGLVVDGVAGPLQTIPALAAAPASKGRWLTKGSKGALVLAVQKKLRYNYPLYAGHIALDSDYGNQMVGVVKEFQRRAGLLVDGIAGEQTLKALGL